jgi:metal-sulfur cluster biosynthetic enzyme
MLDKDAVLTALARVVDPCSIATGVPIGLPEMGMVKTIDITRDDVTVTLRLTSPTCWQAANMIAKVEEILGAIAGGRQVRCALDPTWDWMPDMMSEGARSRLRERRPPANKTAI